MQYGVLLWEASLKKPVDWTFDRESFGADIIFAVFFASLIIGPGAVATVHSEPEAPFWFGLCIVCLIFFFFVLVRLVGFAEYR